jgi:hypothetical protein
MLQHILTVCMDKGDGAWHSQYLHDCTKEAVTSTILIRSGRKVLQYLQNMWLILKYQLGLVCSPETLKTGANSPISKNIQAQQIPSTVTEKSWDKLAVSPTTNSWKC